MKRILIFWILFFIGVGYLAVSSSDNKTQSENLSEKDYIDQTLKRLGWPVQADAGGAFKPVEGAIYLPVRNFYKNQNLNIFGTYNTGRFTGFHTGVDIEVEPEDIAKDVPVYAIYTGMVELVEEALGYGGVLTIRHSFGNRTLAGVYGHVRLRDIRVKKGYGVTSGQLLGYLGGNNSLETGGERKHLHFGLYSSGVTDIRGYVNSESELKSNWINPTAFLRQLSAQEVY